MNLITRLWRKLFPSSPNAVYVTDGTPQDPLAFPKKFAEQVAQSRIKIKAMPIELIQAGDEVMRQKLAAQECGTNAG